ncbi:MAG: ATP-binding protein [Desulfococcaceae bacterium]
MAEDSRVVGKNLLDALTVGMYADNRIIFREYIQNSADAIDKAVAEGVINSREEGRIDIAIDSDKRQILIRDNGIGISSKDIYHILGDIGNSQKSHIENRGFRGIGRLGGLAYCEELQFITSYRGENCKTIMLWDCKELKKYLQPGKYQDMSLIDVINAITVLEAQSEQTEEHYFEVILNGIQQGHDNLLDIDDIQDYLSQVAPVSFDCQTLIALQKINQKLKEVGKEPEEFNIFLNREKIYKPYKVNFFANKKKDFITDINFFESYKRDGSLFFLGWYGITDLLGMVEEENVSGLRARKGNILIGTNRTFDIFFGSGTNQRFNRWFIGEIYIFDNGLIPNTRRDDFEKNDAYFDFKRELEKIIKEKLSRLPREYSDVRSNEKIVLNAPKEIEKIQKELSVSGITEPRRENLSEQVKKLKQQVKRINPDVYSKQTLPVTGTKSDEISNFISDNSSNETDKVINSAKIEKTKEVKDKLLNQLELLENKVETIKKRPSDKIPSSYSRECRKMFDIICEEIDVALPDEQAAQELKQRIIKRLEAETKPKRNKK